MTTDTIISSAIEEYATFSLFAEEVKPEKRAKKQREECIYKQQFEACVKDECQQALNHPTHVSINQAYLMLYKKWMEWKGAVPKDHRNQVGERGHLCIFHAMEQLYLQLRRAELMLAPPMLFLPPAVRAPEPPQLPPPPLFDDICIDEPPHHE